MALCDRLEEQQQERETRHVALARASLAHFADAPTASNLNFLFHKSYIIPPADLRKSILTLAVQGKLVPQNPEEEPASETLQRIRAEVRELAGTAYVRQSDNKPRMQGDEPFTIPSTWQWIQLYEAFVVITDGDHQPPPKTERGVPFLVIGDVRSGAIDFRDTRFVSPEYYESIDPIRRPERGDILYTLVGSFGIPVLVTEDRAFCVQRHIGILKPSRHISEEFFARLLSSELVFLQATQCATGIAQKTVPLSGLRTMTVPLPPHAEQKRIAARVDQLLALVDQLEKQLADSGDVAVNLLEAVVAELVA
jgi:type I restriction enzyme S subunit